MAGRVEKRGKYYVLIPGPSGEMQRVPVDLDRLSISHILEIWMWSTQQSKLVPAHVDVDVSSGFDASHVLETFDDMLTQLLSVLPESDEGLASRLQHLLIEPLKPFRDVIASIAEGRVAAADNALRDVMYGLMSSFGELHESVSRVEQEASGMHLATSMMVNTMEDLPEKVEDMYETWQCVCLELLDALKALSALEDRIGEHRTDAQRKASDWEREAHAWTSTFDEAMTFLDDPTMQRTDTFYLRAFGYMQDGVVDRDCVLRDVATAREHISSCERLVSSAAEAWKTERDRLHEQSMHVHSMIDTLVGTFERLLRKHYKFRDEVFVGSLPPYAIKDSAVSQEQYEYMERLLLGSQWMPDRARRRLKMLAQCLPDDLGSAPQMPEQLASAIAQVSEQIVELEQSVLRDKPESLHQAAPAHADSPVGNVDASGFELDRERVLHLYERMIIVAEVLTCKSQFFALSNVRAMLRVVAQLDEGVDEADVLKYAPSIVELVKRDECCVRVKRTELSDAWQYSRKTWIWLVDPLKKRAILKLSKHASAQAAQLRKKHSITVEQVSAAKGRRDEEARLRFDRKKK